MSTLEYKYYGICNRCGHTVNRIAGDVGQEVACIWGLCNGTARLSLVAPRPRTLPVGLATL